ncbi:MAG TPA: DUF3160 domain-containing protein, partial [Polyangiaceae bacterium]|nr:DUF3160 domain-containing protein [Polyangiaceae bacterium]
MRFGHFACWLALTACGGAGKSAEIPKEEPSAPAAPSASFPGPVELDPSALSFDRRAVPKVDSGTVKVKPKRQGYALPVAKEAVVNLERDVVAQGMLKAGSPELERLLEGGMVIVPGAGARFDQAYGDLEKRNVPILVSADSVLHQQHILFNEILKAVELRMLSPMVTALLSGLHAELVA